MAVSTSTWIIAVAGLLLAALLVTLQLIAILKPYSEWTVKYVYGGSPDDTDPKAYFAFNQGFALADGVFWGPLQIAASTGMMMGQRWGFLLALAASVPFWYSAIPIFVWDRDLGFRRNTFEYWVFIWGMFPLFGVIEMVYSFARLL